MQAVPSGAIAMDTSVKKDVEALFGELLVFAKLMLRDYGEFHPYGGYMKNDGSIVHVGGRISGIENPKATALVATLTESLREKATRPGCALACQ